MSSPYRERDRRRAQFVPGFCPPRQGGSDVPEGEPAQKLK